MRSVHAETTFSIEHERKSVDLSQGEFDSCFFDNCSLGPSRGRRSRIREMVFRNCRQRACSVAGATIENVVVDGLKNASDMPLFLQDVVFQHVTLRGRISQFKINPSADITGWDSADAKRALAEHRAFYEGVDWALDIREAEFTFGPDLQFVPGRLIRYDPATQTLVERSSFDGLDPASLPWEDSALEIGLEWFLDDSPYDAAVLVAPRKSKTFKRDLAAIEMLRARGLAERT